MFVIRRSEDREHVTGGDRESWKTFSPGGQASEFGAAFGALDGLDEIQLAPGAGAEEDPQRDAEIVSYVAYGALVERDSLGRVNLLQAGDFRRTFLNHGLRRSEKNASGTDPARIFHVALGPAEPPGDPGLERKRFPVADRRGALCCVASPDRRAGSLGLGQDARVYSAILARGQHVVHEILRGRMAWLHLVTGALALDGLSLGTGDGVGMRSDASLSFRASEDTEVLLIDLVAPV